MTVKRLFFIVFLSVIVIAFSSCSAKQTPESIAATESTDNGKAADVQSGTTQDEVTQSADEAAEKKIGKTGQFAELQNSHGIVFDGQGNMYVGKKGAEVYKITPDAEISLFVSLESLEDKTDKTHIWNMAMGKDNAIYAAAQDRIIKLSPDGKIESVIKEDYTGEWGACDVKFDADGNMYIAHEAKVEKYDPSLQKTTIIDGKKDEMRLSSVVGIEFDKDYKTLYIGDVFNNKVVRYTIDDGKITGEPLAFRGLGAPEYIAVDENGFAYVSLPGTGGLAKISPDGSVETLSCENKLKQPTTISFGKKGFDENSIYAASDGKIYRVQVGE